MLTRNTLTYPSTPPGSRCSLPGSSWALPQPGLGRGDGSTGLGAVPSSGLAAVPSPGAGGRAVPRGRAAEAAPLTLGGARRLRLVPRRPGPPLGLPRREPHRGTGRYRPAFSRARCSARRLHQKCSQGCPSREGWDQRHPPLLLRRCRHGESGPLFLQLSARRRLKSSQKSWRPFPSLSFLDRIGFWLLFGASIPSSAEL